MASNRKENQVIGLNPHFAGSSRMNIGLTAELKPDENNKLDGSFHAWAEPDDSMESGSYPFVLIYLTEAFTGKF